MSAPSLSPAVPTASPAPATPPGVPQWLANASVPTSTTFLVILCLNITNSLLNAVNFTLNVVLPVGEQQSWLLALFAFNTVLWGSTARRQWTQRRTAQRERRDAESVAAREDQGKKDKLLDGEKVMDQMREIKAQV